MNKVLQLVAVVVFGGLTVAQPACTPAAPGCVAWWAAADNAFDTIGDNHGTLLNGAFFSPGKVGQAFTFDGVNDSVNFGTTAGNFGAGDFTIEFWVKSTSALNQDLLSKRPICGHSSFWHVAMQGVPFIEIDQDAAGTGYGSVAATTSLNDGAFHHVAFVRQGTSLRVFIDGTLNNSATLSAVAAINNTAPVVAGWSPCQPPGTTHYFSGALDEIALYNRALSGAEIQAVFNAGSAGKCSPVCVPPASGLISWWPADGNASDLAGTNNGALQGGTTFAPGIAGQAFNFNGSDADVAVRPIKVTSQFTIEAWIRPFDVGNHRQILSWLANAPDQSYQLGLSPSGALRMDISQDGATYVALVSPDGVLSAGTWAHVAGTFSNGVMRLFVNGAQVAFLASSVGSIFTGTTYSMYLGTTPLGTQRFVGLVDELAVYDRALSSSELQAIYAAGSAGKCQPHRPPFAASQPATWIRTDNAQLNGMATPNGLPALAWFEWGTSYFSTTTPPVPVGSASSVTRTSVTISNLETNTLYFFRLVVSNALGVVQGGERRFITGGRIIHWGDDYLQNFSIVDVPSLTQSAVAADSGHDHGLAVVTDGSVLAWGGNTHHQIGLPESFTDAVAVASGWSHSLALRGNGTVAAWGYNNNGETDVPTGLSGVVEIDAGYLHNLALLENGTVTAWGYNVNGEATVPASLVNVVSIAAGYFHNLALRADGTVAAWGNNSNGQTNVPAALSNVVAVACGTTTSHALLRDGAVISWGQTNGLPGLTNLITIVGGDQTLALGMDGQVRNLNAQANVPGCLYDVAGIAAFASHSLAVGKWCNYFDDAQPLDDRSKTFQDSTVGATLESNEPDHIPTSGVFPNSVWYSWLASDAAGVVVAVSTPVGSEFRSPAVAVYRNSITGPRVANNSSAYYKARVAFTATPGLRYYMVVASTFGFGTTGEGEFLFTLTPNAPPANDLFAFRSVIPGDFFETTGSFIGGSREPGEPTHGPQDLPQTLWWTWTAPMNTGLPFSSVRLIADSISLPPDVGVYTGNSVGALATVSLTANTSNGVTRIVEFTAMAGATYQIALAGQQHDPAGNVISEAYGNYRLRLFNRSVAMTFPTASIATYSTNGLNSCGAASNGFSAAAIIMNNGNATTGPLRIRLQARSGLSARGPTGVTTGTTCDLGTFSVMPLKLSAGGGAAVPLAGAIPPAFDPVVSGGSTGSGTGWGVFAVLEEQELDGTNWLTLDETLVLFGDWPTLGESDPGPGGGVIRLDPNYVGLSNYFRLDASSVRALGPASILEGGFAAYSGSARYVDLYDNVRINNFTNTSWSVTPSNPFAITTNGVFSAGSVTSNTVVTLAAPYASRGLLYTAITNVTVLNLPPPSFTGLNLLSNGSLALGLSGVPHRSHVVEAATNLTPPTVWLPLATNVIAANGLTNFIDLARTNFPRRFFRAREFP